MYSILWLYSLQLDSLLFPFSLQKFELEVQRKRKKKKKQFEQVDLAELLEVAISSHNVGGTERIVLIIRQGFYNSFYSF
jgi:hypothetical protein